MNESVRMIPRPSVFQMIPSIRYVISVPFESPIKSRASADIAAPRSGLVIMKPVQRDVCLRTFNSVYENTQQCNKNYRSQIETIH